jgi:signal peptidase I
MHASVTSLLHAATQALVAPRHFFTAENLNSVRPPRLVYARVMAVCALGRSIYEAIVVGAFDLAAVSRSVVAQFIVALPILYLFASWQHLVARVVLPGRIEFLRSMTVVGYASIPAVFGWNVWLALAAGVWSLGLIALGFARLRGITVSRSAVAPLAAVLLPFTLIFGVRTLALEAFRIPSLGMFPTLLPNDHVFVGKSDFALGQTTPAYGDIVVFDVAAGEPGHAPYDFVERVIARAGDTVEVRNNDLVINGWSAPRCFVGVYQLGDVAHSISVEYLGERPFLVAHAQNEPAQNWGPFTVPSNQVFVVGDNRLGSYDSRAWNGGAGGGVDINRIRGRAFSIWYPVARRTTLSNKLPRLPPNASTLGAALHRCLQQAPELTVPPSN